MATNIPQYSFFAQIYGSEHTARRRGERGKTHSPFKKHYQIENEKYTQRTLHKGYSLRNIYAANTPQGVGDRFIVPVFQSKPNGFNVAK